MFLIGEPTAPARCCARPSTPARARASRPSRRTAASRTNCRRADRTRRAWRGTVASDPPTFLGRPSPEGHTMDHTSGAEPVGAPIYRDDPRLEPLMGPGAPFEVEAVVVDGIALRDFVRAPRTIVDIFAMGDAHADLVHVVYERERWTHGELRARARSLARELRTTFGVRSGDRVGIAMRNLPEYVVAFWGAALNGAIVVPLNAWWQGGELDYALRDAGVTVLFADDERVERVLADARSEKLPIIGVRTERGHVAIDDLVSGKPIA